MRRSAPCVRVDSRVPVDSRPAFGSRWLFDAIGGWAQPRETGHGSRPPGHVASSTSVRTERQPTLAARHLTRAARRSVRAAVLSVLTGVLLFGCADDHEVPEPCGAPTPAFRFEATTLHAPLPDNLTLQVTFGGAQSETYELGSSRVGEVACCVTVAQISDAPAHIPCGATMDAGVVAPNAIVCDLWTNGAVDLTVSVRDEVLITQTLHAKLLDQKSDCGQFETLPAHWVLGEADAGVVVDRH